jgi:hypothetical protein
MGYEYVDWIYLAQDMVRWQTNISLPRTLICGVSLRYITWHKLKTCIQIK